MTSKMNNNSIIWTYCCVVIDMQNTFRKSSLHLFFMYVHLGKNLCRELGFTESLNKVHTAKNGLNWYELWQNKCCILGDLYIIVLLRFCCIVHSVVSQYSKLRQCQLSCGWLYMMVEQLCQINEGNEQYSVNAEVGVSWVYVWFFPYSIMTGFPLRTYPLHSSRAFVAACTLGKVTNACPLNLPDRSLYFTRQVSSSKRQKSAISSLMSTL